MCLDICTGLARGRSEIEVQSGRDLLEDECRLLLIEDKGQ